MPRSHANVPVARGRASAIIGAALAAGFTSLSGQAQNPAHLGIEEYNGPATCVACHAQQARDMFHAVHYQLTGDTPNVPNIPGRAGKLDQAFNTYCGTPMSSRQFTCAACHGSYGKMPEPVLTQAQLENIDCMMCHQDQYKRKAAPPVEELTFVDYRGQPHTWRLPIEDPNGSFQFEPDAANMTISVLEAARTVHLPTRTSCLRCHATAGGGDGTKRGDLSSLSANPTTTLDYHMSPAGRNMSCQDCHEFQNHRVLGRGLDLRENDRPESLTCLQCHPARPHNSTARDNHAARIACQTCHIPTYAKGVSTEIARDWQVPVWAQPLLGGQGGYKPEETRGTDLKPTYHWFDGTSWVYILGQVPPQNAQGEYELAYPYGWPTLAAAKLYPMKEHWSNSARHDATGQLIPHSTFKFFVTGDFNQAVADGQAWSGLTGSWTLVETHTFQTINHGVEPAGNALACGQCHAGFAGGPPRMNLVRDLGYGLKGALTQVCTQCHGYENPPSFSELHNKHVTDKRNDCRWCHNFSRPERGLRMPLHDRPGDLNCDGRVDFDDINPFVTALSGQAGYYATYSCNWYNADCSGDGQVDFGDINPFVGLLTR
ncbi:MAG: hypothetical protein AB1716_11115 [Planctomycetota bacterium]